jgi:hypothetical protein
MNTDQIKIFKAILQELRRIRRNQRLRRDLKETGSSRYRAFSEKPVSIKEEEKALNQIKEAEKTYSYKRIIEPLSEPHSGIKKAEEVLTHIKEVKKPSLILDLSARNITVKNYKQPESDNVFEQLATFLGERFDDLKRLLDRIKKNLSTGSSFTLKLSSSSEISDTTQFCELLSKYAFLSKYWYDRNSKIIHATPPSIANKAAINFFSGGWFEQFVFYKVRSFLSQNSLEYDYLMNPTISLPDGQDFELDLIFLIRNNLLWLECKTGNYQSYIAKYSKVRPMLTIPKENSILIILGITDDLTSTLTNLYDITIANEKNFLAKIAAALNLGELPRDRKLLALLNKVNLRPLPEVRSKVIDQLIKIINSVNQPMILVEIEPIIAERVQISKSKVHDILNAIVRSGCLLNEQGEPVFSFSIPFSTLISQDRDDLEKKCIESYVNRVLTADPTYFDDESKRAEFEQVTGGKVPDTEAIDQLKRKAQTLRNSV